jgi:hypothetical protein
MPELNEQIFQENIHLYLQVIQSLRDIDILGMIDKDTLARIKQTDEHPYFQAYSICHTGTSNPKLLGDTKQKSIHWTTKAVQSLKNIVLKGIKFFRGHNKDNSTNNRDVLGEIVANKEMEINGKLNHVVVSYHKPEVVGEVKKYDICSQEGIWNLFESAGKVIADSVEKITGIALANSNEEFPAFEGAKRLCSVQAFAEQTGEVNKTSGEDVNTPGEGKEKKTMPEEIKELTFKDLRSIKNFIKDNKIHISQLEFTLDDVMSDKVLSKIFVDLDAKNKVLEDEKKGWTEKEKTLSKEKKDLEEAVNIYVSKENLLTSKERFNKYLNGQRNLTTNQKEFITLEFDEEKPEDLADENLKLFIDKKKTEYPEFIKKYAKILPKDESAIETNTNIQEEDEPDKNDMNDARNNDLLPVE